MGFSKKTSLNIFFSACIALSLAFILNSCTEDDNTPPANNTPLPEGNSYLFTSNVSATHTIGSSPCPQVVAEIKTFCGRDGTLCTADSVVITNPHQGLDAKFENGKQSSSLDSDPQKNKVLKVEFNCQVAMSFTHKYKLEFYKGGTKVDEQELTINMTVK
jgi:hypothetical protein